MRNLLLFFCLALVTVSSCKKSDGYNSEKQMQKDEELIKEFLTKNNLNAERHDYGVYYIKSNPGTGNVVYTTKTNVTANYTLRLLNGTVVQKTTEPVTFSLSNVIPGWQIGIQLIQRGGMIRLLIPSVLAYGSDDKPGIPANSVLDFDIELVDVY